MDERHTPKKRSRPPLKSKAKKEPTAAPKSVPEDQSVIEELIKEVIKSSVQKQVVNQHKKLDIIKAMTYTCSEFMKNFIILGYDLDGNAIPPIIFAKSQSDSDALMTYLNYFANGSEQP